MLLPYCLLTNSSFFCIGNSAECIPCPRDFLDNGLRPTKETFDKYLTFFLNDLPDENCAKAGRAAYANVRKLCNTDFVFEINIFPSFLQGLNYISDANGDIQVHDSYFMSYQTTTTKSADFYTALKQARVIADDVQEMLSKNGHDMVFFPYR